MLPRRLPGLCSRRVLTHAVAFACALALHAAAARAFTLTSVRPARDESGQLWVELRLEDPIEPRVAQSLARGMPATLTLHAELWRKRSGWFDRMERTVETKFRLRYEDWDESWRLEHANQRALIVPSLDSLRGTLERTLAMPVGSLERLPQESDCYVVLVASLRPINLEDVEEVEGWLSGEVREKRGSPFGFLTGIPRSLFDAARNFAGFGDERTRIISDQFTPKRLPKFVR